MIYVILRHVGRYETSTTPIAYSEDFEEARVTAKFANDDLIRIADEYTSIWPDIEDLDKLSDSQFSSRLAADRSIKKPFDPGLDTMFAKETRYSVACVDKI